MTKIEELVRILELADALQRDELPPVDRSVAYQYCGSWPGGWDTVYRRALKALPELRLFGLVPGLEGATNSSTALFRSRDGLVRFINLDPGVRHVDVPIGGCGFEWRERVSPNDSPLICRRYVFRGVNDLGVREFEEVPQ